MFDRIEKYYRRNHLMNDEDIVRMLYAMRSIWSDFVKFSLMGVAAWFLNQLTVYLWVILVFTTCRVFLGGLHRKSFWGCAVFTAIQIFVVIYLAELCVLHNIDLVWIASASVSIVLIVGSVVSSEKRRCSQKRKQWFKYVTFVIETIWMIVAWAIEENEIVRQGIYLVILLDNFQVIIAKCYENKRKELKRT